MTWNRLSTVCWWKEGSKSRDHGQARRRVACDFVVVIQCTMTEQPASLNQNSLGQQKQQKPKPRQLGRGHGGRQRLSLTSLSLREQTDATLALLGTVKTAVMPSNPL
jgi:hypothetical protein